MYIPIHLMAVGPLADFVSGMYVYLMAVGPFSGICVVCIPYSSWS